MELLYMKTSDPLLYPHLDFLDFLNIKLGGGKIPQLGYLHPHPVLLTCHADCYLDQ